MAKQKQTKLYDGDVAFDHFGNPLDYLPNKYGPQKTRVSTRMINGDYLMIDQHSYANNTFTVKKSHYTLSELNFKLFDVPVDDRYDKTLYIGEVDTYVYVKNAVFDEVLQFVEVCNGPYSASFTFKSTLTDKTYDMFVKDFNAIVPEMVNGVVAGKFAFTKRGNRIAIRKV